MNKTVNINLGGMFFHIDEDAFQKLSRYFDAIKRSLTDSNGQDEIIKDIEMRIAEIITEKHTNEKQVINLREVDDVIAIMGQPEDYRIENEPSENPNTDFTYTKRSKKLYRDTDKGMVGGVATGLGHYFGIDSVWLRILFIAFVLLSYGTGVLAYFILWIVTPAAVTTAEKLEMTGEPVNISNIEKKVREEFDNLSERFKGGNYDQMGKQVKTGFERAAGNVGDALLVVFKAFAKVLGAIIVVIAASGLAGMVIALFTLGSTSFVDLPWHNNANAVNYTDLPLWTIGLLGFFAIGIPFFFLMILGLKLLVTNLKSIGNITKYTLLAIWLIAVASLITLGVKQATEMSFDGKVVQKETLAVAPTDTLEVKFAYNDYYAKDIDREHDYLFSQDENGKELIYSNRIELHILRTEADLPYIQVEKVASGKTFPEAKQRAEKINYSYKIEGNKLIFDNYLLTDKDSKYRNQEVKIYLYVPKGTLLKPDSSIQNYDYSDDSFFNLHYSGDYLYRAGATQIDCLNCPDERNDDNAADWEVGNVEDITTDSTTMQNSASENNKEFTGLKANEQGVIIKK